MTKISKFVMLGALLASSAGFFSCKRLNEKPVEPDYSSEYLAQNRDEEAVQLVLDSITAAVSNYLVTPGSYANPLLGVTTSYNFNGRAVSIDTSGTGYQREARVVFSDAGEGFRGTITWRLDSLDKWTSTRSSAVISFSNFSLNTSVGRVYFRGGSVRLVNLFGNHPKVLGFEDNCQNDIVADLQVAFGDGSTRAWTVRKRNTWVGNNSGTTDFSYSARDSVNGIPRVLTVGSSRNGTSFSTQLRTPISFVCPTAPRGSKTVAVSDRLFDVVYSTNEAGAVVPTGCASNFRISYVNRLGVPKSLVARW